MPQFLGKIIFLENYDMRLAKRLISGVDIWLNTPTRPLEASGTSGEKAQMNGVLNFSVLDGWWLEGYVKGAGWALTDKRTYENQEHQDQLDAATIYSMLENEIIPLYYAKNTKGFATEWIQFIKNSIAQINPRFTTKRMIDDYLNKFYFKLAKRSAMLKENNFAKAKEIAAWKENMSSKWYEIEITEVNIPEKLIHDPHVGEDYPLEVVIDTKGLNDKGIGIELVVVKKDKNNKDLLHDVEELNLVRTDGSKMYFSMDYQMNLAGSFKYAFRMFPKNENLPHRQDFCRIGEVVARLVEQHLAQAPAQDHAEDAPKEQVVELFQAPADVGLAPDALAPEEIEGGEGHQVHETVPAHGQGAEGNGNGIELGVDEHGKTGRRGVRPQA